jgi:hypothetical protein
VNVPAELYLRFRSDDGTHKVWLRQNLFSLGWRKVERLELASPFPTRDQAEAFAQKFHLGGDVELVTMNIEELRR